MSVTLRKMPWRIQSSLQSKPQPFGFFSVSTTRSFSASRLTSAVMSSSLRLNDERNAPASRPFTVTCAPNITPSKRRMTRSSTGQSDGIVNVRV